MVTGVSTSNSIIRSWAAGGWRDAPLSDGLDDSGGKPPGTNTFGQETQEERVEVLAPAEDGFIQPPSPRLAELTPVISRLLAFCEGLDHRIIGISSDGHASGVSLLTRELARGYADLGRPACLIDASRFNLTASARHGASALPLDLRPLSQHHRDGYQKIDLHDLPTFTTFGTAEFRESLSPWMNDAGVVLVDLPPVCEPDGIVGAACDVVLLICLTGVVKTRDFCRCLMQCRARRMKVGGVVLNDWNLTGSQFMPCC